MDLAAWRMRDTIVGYGDFAELYDRYDAAQRASRSTSTRSCATTSPSRSRTSSPSAPRCRQPPPDSDLMTNMQWCCETNLFATEALAEILDVELPTVEMPEPRESRGRDRARPPDPQPRVGPDRRRVPPLQAADDVPDGPPRVARIDEIGDELSAARPRRSAAAPRPPARFVARGRGRARALRARRRRHRPLRPTRCSTSSTSATCGPRCSSARRARRWPATCASRRSATEVRRPGAPDSTRPDAPPRWS